MRKINKILALIPMAAMVFGLLAMIPPAASAATIDNVNTPGKFLDALSKKDSELVINIAGSFITTSRMGLSEGRNVTINLNGNTINLRTSGGINNPGLRLYDGAVLTINGPGAFNITSPGHGIWATKGSSLNITGNAVVTATSNGENRHGVYALGGSKIDVTTAVSNERGGDGAYATGAGSTVNVVKDVTVNGEDSVAVFATDGGTVNVGGNVLLTKRNGRAAYALGKGSKVNVAGNITVREDNSYGACAIDGGSVTVAGNITVARADSYGAYARDNGSRVDVSGNITASRSNGYGVYASNRSIVTVDGDVSATGSRGIGVYAGYYANAYIGGGITGNRSDIKVGGSYADPDEDAALLSVSNPVKRNVLLSAPFDGFYWDEFNNESHMRDWTHMAHVYKRQSAVVTQETPVAPDTPAAPVDSIAAFTERMYLLCLGRESDATGLETWTGLLRSGAVSASEMAYEFFFSSEMKGKNLSIEQFITTLYKTMLDRDPDTAGIVHWSAALGAGTSREDVFAGFAGSSEFASICNEYGIKR